MSAVSHYGSGEVSSGREGAWEGLGRGLGGGVRRFGRRRDVRCGEKGGRIGLEESVYRLGYYPVDEHLEWLRCALGEGGKEASMLLGELLIYRYGLITKDQRQEALARQKGAPTCGRRWRSSGRTGIPGRARCSGSREGRGRGRRLGVGRGLVVRGCCVSSGGCFPCVLGRWSMARDVSVGTARGGRGALPGVGGFDRIDFTYGGGL